MGDGVVVIRRGRRRPKPPDLPADVLCDSCGSTVGQVRGGKLFLRVQNRTLVVRADGGAETNCPVCHLATRLPLRIEAEQTA